MSLHVHLSTEAEARLRSQRRNSTISAVLISMLFLVLVGLVLGFFLLKPILEEPPVLAIYQPQDIQESNPDPTLVHTNRERTPTSPSRCMTNVLVASRATSVASIPVPDVDVSTPSMEYGDIHDFGQHWQDVAAAPEGSGGGGFGSPTRQSGGLEGWLYDLKQTPKGKNRVYEPGNRQHFTEPVMRLQRGKFSPKALAEHYRAPKPLYLTHLAIPEMSALKAPELFGAKHNVEPSGLIAHYRGTVIVPRTGLYRFSGLGDDYMVVMLDGKARLFASHPDLNHDVKGRWEGSRAPDHFRAPYHNYPLIAGDWVSLRAGQEVEMDLAIGERPGGELWFFLFVEERGVEYRKAADGRPILPLFTTAPFTEEDMAGLRAALGSYEIEFDDVPVFRVR